MEKPEDDLPPFYIEAAKAVVLMHPFPNEAETGKAIEAVRCAILSAVEEEREACAQIVERNPSLANGSLNAIRAGQEIASAIRNRKGA